MVDDQQLLPSSPTRRRPVPPGLLRLRLLAQSRPRSAVAAALLAVATVLYLLVSSTELKGGDVHAAEGPTRFDREREGGEVEFPALEELVDRDRLWPPDLSKPLCDLKIYVYDLPSHLRLPESTSSQCRWSAYNSELQLHALLTDPTSAIRSELVTTDPAEADVFFIPLFPACYSFNCWVKAGWIKTERCNVDQGYIQPVMEWVKAQPWWSRHGGADHLMAHPMDFGDGYFTEESRLAMNESMYLVTVGDHRPKPFSAHYRHHRDILIPSSTHLLNSYFINPLDYVDERGNPRPTPIGAADPDRKTPLVPTRAEIWESSPVLTPSWRKKLASALAGSSVAATLHPNRRPTTAIFRGGVGQPGEGESYALSIRSLFFPSSGNASAPPFSPHPHPGFSSLPGYDIAEWSDNDPYARALASSRFGLVPPGYTLDTTRLYEYLAFGVVPVFVGTGPHHGQALPFERDFDYDRFSISIGRSEAHRVPQILAGVAEERYEGLRREVWAVGRRVVLEGRKGEVWRWIARDLCRIRRIGTGAGPEISNN